MFFDGSDSLTEERAFSRNVGKLLKNFSMSGMFRSAIISSRKIGAQAFH